MKMLISSRGGAVLIAALTIVGSGSSLAAIKTGHDLPREEEDRARLKVTEKPLATQGLKGLREERRSALRPAKLENRAEGHVLTATPSAAFRDLRPPRPTFSEILHTNIPELLVVKALTAIGVKHETLAALAESQGQKAIQIGLGRLRGMDGNIYRQDGTPEAALTQSAGQPEETRAQPAAKRKRSPSDQPAPRAKSPKPI